MRAIQYDSAGNNAYAIVAYNVNNVPFLLGDPNGNMFTGMLAEEPGFATFNISWPEIPQVEGSCNYDAVFNGNRYATGVIDCEVIPQELANLRRMYPLIMGSIRWDSEYNECYEYEIRIGAPFDDNFIVYGDISFDVLIGEL